MSEDTFFPRSARTPAPLLPLLVAVPVILLGCGSSGESAEAAARPSTTPGAAGSLPTTALPARGEAWVIFGADTVVAEVARTAEEREEGLMYRDEVPDGTGMLFVWDDARVRSFWMQNTFVALDVAFIDADYRIVDIQQMEQQTTDQHESARPAMFALEVRKGWFAEHGIEVGDTAQIVFGG